MELEQIPFDFSALVDEAVQMHAVKAKEKRIDLNVEMQGVLPDRVIGDPASLRQVLMSLIGNAVKFTEKGGVSVTVAAQLKGGADITLQVRDTGIGIAPDVLQSIFTDMSTTRQYSAAGPGLFISRQLVELMGGKLTAESTLGRGAAFTMRLRLPVADVANLTQTEEGPSLKPAGAHRDFRILVVEDNKSNILVISTLLEHYGYSFTLAQDGKEALDMINQEPFSLVLMDVHMPKMDGYKTTQMVREQEKETGKHLHIVGMTACALRGDKERCLEAGMDGYISKPFDPDEFISLLQRISGESASSGEAYNVA